MPRARALRASGQVGTSNPTSCRGLFFAGHRRSQCVVPASPARHASSPGLGSRARAHARMTTSSHAHLERCASRWLAGLPEVVIINGRRRRRLPGHHHHRPQLLWEAGGVSATHNHPYTPYPPQPPATAPEDPAPSPRPAPCAPASGSPCMLVGPVVSFSTRTAGMLLVVSCSVRVVASERVRRVCSVWLMSASFGLFVLFFSL